MPTTSLGLTYPASTGHTRIWEHIQTLATNTDGLLNTLFHPPMAQLRQTVAQTFTTGTWAAVLLDAEDHDTANGHSTSSNTSRYTAQVAGYYQLSGGVSWASSTAITRWCRWAKNGTELNGTGGNQNAANTGQALIVARTITVSLNVGDYVELQGAQFAGANLDTYVGVGYAQSIMSVRWVSSL